MRPRKQTFFNKEMRSGIYYVSSIRISRRHMTLKITVRSSCYNVAATPQMSMPWIGISSELCGAHRYHLFSCHWWRWRFRDEITHGTQAFCSLLHLHGLRISRTTYNHAIINNANYGKTKEGLWFEQSMYVHLFSRCFETTWRILTNKVTYEASWRPTFHKL